uniref:Mitochondrial fission process protein 1 n=1 Tax=Attheya septentrionalis TaxID=420275 RepID=A0A7S2UT13_9STRA|mmetsp:Transcript_917/g.1708  ORF Transcript_917/g.1708 Transcript_917/m.1708 type:complete len:177 (+) Transcript_917:142-672(+)
MGSENATLVDGKIETSEKKYNVFRDSPLRYMGYANEIGESFRYQFPKIVAPSYMLAFGYCFLDSASTGYDEWNKEDNGKSERSREVRTALATFDTLLWQTFASVTIPGATINMIVRASRFAVSRVALPVTIVKWLPTAIGIGSIPLIIHPIDDLVDYSMDNSIRKWMKEEETDKQK